MKKLIPILLIVMFMGCATTSLTGQSTAPPKELMAQLVELNQNYIKAIETLKLSAGDLANIAAFEIGFLKESVGADISKLPGEATQIMAEYKKLADQMAGGQGLTDYQKGQIIGMRWRFLYVIGDWLWKTYGVGILSALKLAF